MGLELPGQLQPRRSRGMRFRHCFLGVDGSHSLLLKRSSLQFALCDFPEHLEERVFFLSATDREFVVDDRERDLKSKRNQSGGRSRQYTRCEGCSPLTNDRLTPEIPRI